MDLIVGASQTKLDLIVVVPFVVIMAVFIAFHLGQYTKSSPTEDEMMQRLIDARLERKLLATTREGLEREIEAASASRVSA